LGGITPLGYTKEFIQSNVRHSHKGDTNIWHK